MTHDFLKILTNLGDSAITLAFTAALAAYLLFFRQRKAALALLASYALTAVCIALGKSALYSQCPMVQVPFNLRSPSGHSALSLVSYGMFGLFMASSLKSWKRILLFCVVFSLIALIAASRVLLGYHTVSDVAVALLGGGLISYSMVRFLKVGSKVSCPWAFFILLAVALLALLYGHRLPSEDFIKLISGFLRQKGGLC